MKVDQKNFAKRVKSFTDSAISKGVDQGLAGADEQRLMGLKQMSRLRQVKEKALQKEEKYLSNKYGKDSLRVKDIKRTMSANKEYTRAVEFEVAKASVSLVTVDDNSFVVHGKVFDLNLHPLPDMIVALYDTKGKRIRKVDHVCTDTEGYFKMGVERGKVEEEKTGIEKDNGPGAMPVTNESIRILNDKSLAQLRTETAYIYIFDKNKKLIYKSDQAVAIKLNSISYREIVIEEECAECVAPPDIVTGKKPGTKKPGNSKKPKTTPKVTKKKRQEDKKVEDVPPLRKKKPKKRPKPERKKAIAKKKVTKKKSKRARKKTVKKRTVKVSPTKVTTKKTSTKVKKRSSKKKRQ